MNQSLKDRLFWFILTAVIVIGLYYLVLFLIRLWAKRTKSFVPTLIDRDIHLPGILLIIAFLLNISVNFFQDFVSARIYSLISHGANILQIIALGYFFIKLVTFFKSVIIQYKKSKNIDDFALRSASTKFNLIQ